MDEIHQEVLKRRAKLRVKIARREILYLFEAYCTLLRASSSAKDDVEWLAQVEKNGGIIVSMDGIQEDTGNETVYLVRDALDFTGAGRRECDVVGDRGDESAAGTSGSVRGVRAGDDQRCPRKREAFGGAAVAGRAAPGLPIPCATRCDQARL